MAASKKETARIQHAARQLLAADANLRTLSWNRVREIAEALSVKKLRGSERRAYARELRLIAATNLEVAARLKGTDEHHALQSITEGSAGGQTEVASESEAAAGEPAQPGAHHPAGDNVSYDAEVEAEVANGARAESSAAESSAGDSARSRSSMRGSRPAAGFEADADSDGDGDDAVSVQVESAPGWSAPGESAASIESAARPHGRSGSTPDEGDAGQRHNRAASAPDERDGAAAGGESESASSLDAAQAEAAVPDAAPSEGEPSDEAAADTTSASANPDYDEKGRWIGDTAPVNVVQMINAEMVYQSDDEDDKDRHAAAAAQASLYDDPVSVVLPSADELDAMLPTIDEMVDVENEELKREVEAEHLEYASAQLSDHDRTPVAEKGEPSAPGAGGSKPADPKPAEGEPSISFGFSEHSRAERAILADKQKKEAKKARKKGAAAGADHGKDADHKSSGRKHRFSFFGRHNTENMPVIPRGKSDFAPDDLFVIDKHRAAQAKEREADKQRVSQGARVDAGASEAATAQAADSAPADRAAQPAGAKADHASDAPEKGGSSPSSTDDTASLDTEHEPAHRPEHARVASAEPESAATTSGHTDAAQADRPRERRQAATFELLHLSSGGRVAFYRDADGHITAVDTARFV